MAVELKLQVTAQGARALQQHPILKKYAAQAHKQKFSDTYFDTPDFYLRRFGTCLRVRKIGTTWIQTLKGIAHCNGAKGGLHCRDEWESPIEGPHPDLAVLCDMAGDKHKWQKMLRSSKLANSLSPISSTKIKRTAWTLFFSQGDEVECVLDQGTLVSGNKKALISEIKLKLKSGDATRLFDIALALQQDIPIKMGSLSMPDRAYAMLMPQPYAAFKATPIKLRKQMTVNEAFQEITGNCMAQIESNELGVALRYETEGLHQMRVGLRRLRSAFGLFKQVLPLPAQLQQEMDWLSGQLGGARDWDVLGDSTLPLIIHAVPNETRLSELVLAVQARVKEEHKIASSAVNSARYTRFMLCMARWLQGPDWPELVSQRNQSRLEAGVWDFAQHQLKRGGQGLLKHGQKFAAMGSNERHRVRIAAKKMRYATEFFASLFSRKKVRPYVEALASLQDELGWLNDAAVADRLLKDMQGKQRSLNLSLGFVRGYLASSVNCNNRKLCKLWKKFIMIQHPS
jgi:triphosphatase